MKVRKGKILCAGMLCVDMINYCKTFPAEDSLSRTDGSSWQKGGNAANTSGVLGLLGNDVDYFGSLPQDDHDFSSQLLTNFVRQQMGSFGVGMQHTVPFHGKPLPFSVVILNKEKGTRTILHTNLGIAEPTIEDFKQINLDDYSWISFEGRNVNEFTKMIDHVVAYNSEHPNNPIIISVELERPNRPGTQRLIPHADLLLVGRDYAIAHGAKTAMEAVEMFKKKAKMGSYIICPWGEHGAASGIAGVADDVTMTPAVPPKEVVDTLGAGDTFLGALIHYLFRGRELKGAVAGACAVAGHKCGHEGYECVRSFKGE